MQNEFLPEEKPAYQTPAPLSQQAETTQNTFATMERAALAMRQAAHRKRLKWRYRGRALSFTAGLIAAGVSVFIGLVACLASLPVANTPLTLALMLCLLVGFASYMIWTIRRKPLIQANDDAEIGGAEAVGPLLEMIETAVHERDLRALYDALTPRLLALNGADADNLTPRHYHLLRQLLWSNILPVRAKPPETDFCIAALAALEQIGDAKFVPLVERMTRMKTPTAEKARIRDAAVECLPLLKARAGLTAASQILLRASAPEPAGRDTLLRPASGGNETNPKELLRPSDRSE